MITRRMLAWLTHLMLCAASCSFSVSALAQLDLDLEGEAELDLDGDAEAQAGAEVESEDVPAEESMATEAAAEPEASADEPDEEEASESPAADELPQQRALTLYMAAGLGVGSLSFTRPTAAGVQHLPESAFAAAEALMRVQLWPAEAFSLEAEVAYQSSLGFVVELPILFALPERTAARVQRVELSVAPRLSFSSSKRGLALAVPVGFALRSFFPEVHYYSVKAHNLGSLFVRPELIVPLGELITLRGGPELHWLVFTEPSLAREGATGSGYGLGLQAAVQARVGDTFSVALAYHQLHSVIPAAARFEDTERFLTARFGGAL